MARRRRSSTAQHSTAPATQAQQVPVQASEHELLSQSETVFFDPEVEFIKLNAGITMEDMTKSSVFSGAGIKHPIQLLYAHYADVISLGDRAYEYRNSVIMRYLGRLKELSKGPIKAWTRFSGTGFADRFPVRIASGSRAIDEVMGLSTGMIAAVYGPEGVGKTQLGLSIAAHVMLPRSVCRGDRYEKGMCLGSSVVIFDFEGAFSLSRMEEIVRVKLLEAGLSESLASDLASRLVQERLVLLRTTLVDAVHFIEFFFPLLWLESWRRFLNIPARYDASVLEELVPSIPSRPIRLVIMDGVSQAAISEAFALAGLEKGSMNTRAISSQLKRKLLYSFQVGYCPSFNVAVYTTFQVRQRLGTYFGGIEAAASFALRHNVHIIAEIKREKKSKGLVRVLRIVKSARGPEREAEFDIYEGGVRDA